MVKTSPQPSDNRMEGEEGKGVGSGFVGALGAKKDRQRSVIYSVQLF